MKNEFVMLNLAQVRIIPETACMTDKDKNAISNRQDYFEHLNKLNGDVIATAWLKNHAYLFR